MFSVVDIWLCPSRWLTVEMGMPPSMSTDATKWCRSCSRTCSRLSFARRRPNRWCRCRAATACPRRWRTAGRRRPGHAERQGLLTLAEPVLAATGRSAPLPSLLQGLAQHGLADPHPLHRQPSSTEVRVEEVEIDRSQRPDLGVTQRGPDVLAGDPLVVDPCRAARIGASRRATGRADRRASWSG